MVEEATSKQEVSGSSPIPRVLRVYFFVRSTLNSTQKYVRSTLNSTLNM